MTNTKYGVFWIPSKRIINIIQSWKERVYELEPNAIYLDHPVHCTFFLIISNIQKENDLINCLEECCKLIPKFIIEFDNWHIFWSDKSTGGDTISLQIKPNNVLFYLQEKIATSLMKFKERTVGDQITWQGDYLLSQEKYGFPFIGKHWLPHISVASVCNKGKNIIEEIINSKDIKVPELISKISLFRIDGRLHEHIKSFNLK
jgi:hypothetical protein